VNKYWILQQKLEVGDSIPCCAPALFFPASAIMASFTTSAIAAPMLVMVRKTVSTAAVEEAPECRAMAVQANNWRAPGNRVKDQPMHITKFSHG
jgi:hypothetical protein